MPEETKPASGGVSSVAEMKARPAPEDPRKPDSPADLKKIDWKLTLKSTVREFGEDQLTDLAAALTYFSVLSLFPALIALVSILSLFGFQGEAIRDLINQLAQQGVLPSESVKTLAPVLDGIINQTPAPGLGLVLGILTAAWAASNYVKAFGRAMNRVYEVQEGRPGIKLNLQLYALTLGLLALMGVAVMLIVVSGPMTQAIGQLVNAPGWLLTAFDWIKLPILAGVIVVMLALLYHFTPNVRQPKMRWLSVGAITAIALCAVASLLLGLYLNVAGNKSYTSTYGALAGVIIFLFWLWIMNTVLLFGAELDAELERARELRAGLKAEEVIQLPPRDTRAAEKAEKVAREQMQEAKKIRLSAEHNAEGVNGSGSDYSARGVAADRVHGSDARRPEERGAAHKITKDELKAAKKELKAARRTDPMAPAASWMSADEKAVAEKAKEDRRTSGR